MTDIDLSSKALNHLKVLAQKATPTSWEADVIADILNERSGREADAAYIAAVHPYVLLAMCEEIEQLRERVATLERLSGEDDACMTQLEVERDALEEQVARLEKEADWLAIELAKRGRGCKWWCDQYHNGCIPSFVPCGYKGSDIWREAARKGVEEDSHE